MPSFPDVCETLGFQDCGPVDCTEHREDREALVDCLGDRAWLHAGGTEKNQMSLACRDIVLLNDPYCAFEDGELDELLPDADSLREFSIQFWLESLTEQDCLQPQLRLLNGDGMTFAATYNWAHGMVPDPPAGSGCLGIGDHAFSLRGGSATEYKWQQSAEVTQNIGLPKPGERHLVTIGLTAEGKCAFFMDTKSDSDWCTGAHLMAGKDFLRVVNIQGGLRMSPWRVSTVYPTSGDISVTFYRERPIERRKQGASPKLGEQMEQRVPRDMNMFTAKSLLIAPPLVMQTRSKAGACDWDFSTEVKDRYARIGSTVQCAWPYECGHISVYECPAGEADDLFFGLELEEFPRGSGEEVYVEYLATIAEVDTLARMDRRGGQVSLMQTENFVDALTTEVRIAALLYSVEYNIMTLLDVSFSTDSGRVEGESEITHFVALTGDVMSAYMAMTWPVIACMVILLLDNIKQIKRLFHFWQEGKLNDETAFVAKTALDLTVQLSLVAFLVVSFQDRVNSGPVTSDIVSRVTSIEWWNDATTFEAKKSLFLDDFTDVRISIAWDRQIKSFAMFILLILMLNIVLATNAHPRISLITATVSHLASDMFHFLLIFVLVFMCFAFIATWRFGELNPQLGSLEATVWTQMNALLGPPGDIPLDLYESYEYVMYALLFNMICFFFMLNFVLAIIVDAYGRVMSDMDANVTEQDLVSDTWSVISVFPRYLMTFPARSSIIKYLIRLDKYFVTEEDLFDEEDSDLPFKSLEAARLYVEHYSGFDFLIDEEADGDSGTQQAALLSHTKNIAQVFRKVEMLSRESKQMRMMLEKATGHSSVPNPRHSSVPMPSNAKEGVSKHHTAPVGLEEGVSKHHTAPVGLEDFVVEDNEEVEDLNAPMVKRLTDEECSALSRPMEELPNGAAGNLEDLARAALDRAGATTSPEEAWQRVIDAQKIADETLRRAREERASADEVWSKIQEVSSRQLAQERTSQSATSDSPNKNRSKFHV